MKVQNIVTKIKKNGLEYRKDHTMNRGQQTNTIIIISILFNRQSGPAPVSSVFGTYFFVLHNYKLPNLDEKQK